VYQVSKVIETTTVALAAVAEVAATIIKNYNIKTVNYSRKILSTLTRDDVINNDAEEKFISDVRIKNVAVSPDQFFDETVLNGDGYLTFSNGDYFVGEFFGSVSDREGILTKIRQNSLKTFATWKNGLLEVSEGRTTVVVNTAARIRPWNPGATFTALYFLHYR
jgi:hypothetical protein